MMVMGYVIVLEGRREGWARTSEDYIYDIDSNATKIDWRKLNRDDGALECSRFHVYDALPPAVLQV